MTSCFMRPISADLSFFRIQKFFLNENYFNFFKRLLNSTFTKPSKLFKNRIWFNKIFLLSSFGLDHEAIYHDQDQNYSMRKLILLLLYFYRKLV